MEIAPIDQAERAAALDLSQSYIVQAPAGSGKTELLIQRYLSLLANVSAPEEILAVTFTKKAALEMRHRIMRALSLATHAAPEKSHHLKTWTLAKAVLEKNASLQWALQYNPHRLRIFTIDALCHSLVRQAPFKSGLSDHVQMIENGDEVYVKAIHELLNSLQTNAPWVDSLKCILMHLDNNIQLLETVFVELLKKRDQWLMHLSLKQLEPSFLRDYLEKNLRKTIEAHLHKLKKAIPEKDHSELIALAQFAGMHANDESEIKHCLKMTSLPSEKAESLTQWRGLKQMLMTQEGCFRKMVDVRSGFPVGKDKNEKELFQEMKKRIKLLLSEFSENKNLEAQFAFLPHLPTLHYTSSQWDVLRHILIVLPVLVAHLKLIFQQTRKTDYVEVMLKTLEALGNDESPSDLILNLDYKIQHILVDEFQDTSFAQFHLLEKLTSGWQPDEGRTLFLVGDPQQSIYRFRKAEVGLFLRAAERGINHVFLAPLLLSSNFRSHKTILIWINSLFSKIFPKQNDKVTGAIVFSPSFSNRKEDVSSHIEFHYGQDEKGVEEAWKIKEIIHSLLKNDPTHKIAILVRSRVHLSQIIPLLKTYNIPFNASEVSSLAESSVIQDLMALTRALFYLTDRTAWLALLRAPWCGLMLADLTHLAKSNEIIWDALAQVEALTLSEAGLNRCLKIRKQLEKILLLRQHMPLDCFIEYAWKTLQGDHCLEKEEDSLQVERFFRFLSEIDEGGDIHDRNQFEKRVYQLFIQEKNSHHSSVEVMTVHKAKGLEFDTVILPQLQANTAHDAHALLLWLERPNEQGEEDLLVGPLKSFESQDHDPIYHYLRSIENQKSENELCRLLYVAMTRAKQNLYFTWTEKENDFSPSPASFLSLMWPHIQCETRQKISSPNNVDVSFQTPLYRFEDRDVIPSNSISTNEEIKNEKIENLVEKRIERNVGILIHRVFMAISKTNSEITSEKIDKEKSTWKTILQGLGTPASALEKSVTLAHEIIKRTLQDKVGKWLLSPHENSKINYPVALCRGKKIEHAVIDRLFTDENGRHWLILFKMDEVASEAAANFNVLTKSAEALFDGLESIMLGVYFPFQSLFLKRAVKDTQWIL